MANLFLSIEIEIDVIFFKNGDKYIKKLLDCLFNSISDKISSSSSGESFIKIYR